MPQMPRALPQGLLLLSLVTFACGGRQPPVSPPPPPFAQPPAISCPVTGVGPNVQITTILGESKSPQIVFAKDAFGIAWWDLRGESPEVRVVRVDHAGMPRSPERKLSSDKPARQQSLSWDGAELNVIWQEGRSIITSHLQSSHEAPERLTETGEMPAAGAYGAAVWVDAGRLFFRSDAMTYLPDERGRIRSPEPPVAIAEGGIENPVMAWNGQLFAMVWSASVAGGREIRLQRVRPTGERVGAPVKVSGTAGLARKPSVAIAGDGFAVAWTSATAAAQQGDEAAVYKAYLSLIPAIGDAPLFTRELDFAGSNDEISIACSGKELAVTWLGTRQPRGTAVYFKRYDLQGKPLGKPLEVTDGKQLTVGRPSISFAGDGYGVAWHDDRAQTGSEVYFSFLKCGTDAATAVDALDVALPKPEPRPALKDVF